MKHTKGAMRAAEAIDVDSNWGHNRAELAEIIDRETGLPELLEAMNESYLFLASADSHIHNTANRQKLWTLLRKAMFASSGMALDLEYEVPKVEEDK